MKSLTFLALIALCASLTVNPEEDACDCSDLVTSADCAWGCFWDNTEQECRDEECSDYTTESTCDSDNDCAWTNDKACADFTKCSDYSVDVASKCGQRGNCVASATATNGLFACSDAPTTTPTYVTCGSFNTPAACTGWSSATAMCAWKAGAATPVCASLEYDSECSAASQFSDAYCDDNSCKWDATAKTCSAITCEDIKVAGDCDLIDVIGTSDFIICAWADSKCSDAEDVDHLTSTNCYAYSVGTYYWDSDSKSCEECSASTFVSALIIASLLILA